MRTWWRWAGAGLARSRSLTPAGERLERRTQMVGQAGVWESVAGDAGVAGTYSGRERGLQAECERLLGLAGYARMTAEHATIAQRVRAMGGEGPFRGWFGHLNKAGKNALLGDLVITNADCRRCLFVELKRGDRRPRFQPGQREMIEIGAWVLVQGIGQFAGVMVEFEKGG
jgi:hypothetical protein